MYEIIDYSEKAIAVCGDTKAFKDNLKSLGGRFNPRLTCGAGWVFPKSKREQLTALLNGESAIIVTKKVEKQLDIFLTKDEIRQIFIDEGDKGSFLDYMCKTYSLGVRLSNGLVVMAEKRPLETRFCFGYGFCGMSTEEDEDRADDAKHNADTNPDYFRDENLRELRGIVQALKTGKRKRKWDYEDDCRYVYLQKCYTGESIRRSLYFSPWTLDDLQSGRIRPDYMTKDAIDNLMEISADDKMLITKLYEKALADRTKRVETYLKKYGLSKLTTWTYLSD